MKVPKNIVTREADLSFKELEDLAEEIRRTATRDQAYTIREYVRVVSSMDVDEFGYRKGRALLFEPKLESYFPDKVFEALRKKGREQRHHQFNKDDDDFISINIQKGIEWLKERFYTETKTIYEKIDELNLGGRLQEDDFLLLAKYKYELSD